jgi:hypothetical protein
MVGGGCSEYVPAGGGYRGIVNFFLTVLFLFNAVCGNRRPDKTSSDVY